MIQVKQNQSHAIIEETSKTREFFTSIAKKPDDRGLYQIFTTIPLKVRHADAFEKQTVEIKEETYKIEVKRIDFMNGFLHLSIGEFDIDELKNEDHYNDVFKCLLEIIKETLHNPK